MLEQNYPNPFNPQTQIPFTLNEARTVHLNIYNTLGQLVDTLIDGVVPAGEHTITWDATDMPSGSYLYRLAVDGKSLQRYMMLVR